MSIHFNFLFSFPFLFLILLKVSIANGAQVESFYPTGSVKQVRQITVRFSADVVAMGDPKVKKDPFAVDCNKNLNTNVNNNSSLSALTNKPKYITRWADNKNWVLEFDSPLPAGMRCVFQLKSDFQDLSGEKLVGLSEYSFTTSGPAVLHIEPNYGMIEPEQYFVLQLDGDVDLKSVESKTFFEVEGVPDKVNTKIISGKDRDSILLTVIKGNWQWETYQNLLKRKSNMPISEIKELNGFIVLAANRRFPEEAKVVFHWPKGVLSKSGLPVETLQTFDFSVIKSFQALFSCERTTPDRPCNPILDMGLNFTQRVPLKSLNGTKLVAADGKTWTPNELKKTDANNNEEFVNSLSFKAPFPDFTKFKLFLPANLKDELGRPLVNQNKYPLNVSTDEYSPLIKFPAKFGIIEWKAEPVLPVSVRNIEKQMSIQQVAIEGKTLNLSGQTEPAEIISWYKKIINKDYQYNLRNSPVLAASQGVKLQMPKPMKEKDFELVGIPLKKPGFYVVEMNSPRLGAVLTNSAKPMYVATSALVTDMAVHFKKGRESSLVWVTQLSNAKPVSGAQVSILDINGKELAKGLTNNEGILRLSSINYSCTNTNGTDVEGGYSYGGCEFFAFAKKDDDFSFVSSNWEKGIETYRFNVPTEYLNQQWGPTIIHTVMDRMVAQPGESIQMKHILREHRETGFAMMNENLLPKRVLIVHQGSGKTYTLPFVYDKSTGTAIGKFLIPKEATLGRYSVFVSNKSESEMNQANKNNFPVSDSNENGYSSETNNNPVDPMDWTAKETGHFIVSEYRLPLMKTAVKIQGEPLVRPTEVKADLSASYLSGGPAKGLKVKLRASLQPGYFTPDVPGGSDFSFFAIPVKTGLIDSENHQSKEESFLKVQDLVLNAEGGLLAKITNLPAVTKIQQLAIEMEYTDPNGEVKTASSHVPLFPADYVIGLRSDSWFAEPGKTKVMGVITNNLGKPQSGKSFLVEAFRTNYISHRKRLVGGFYSYDSKTEVIALGKVCEGKSDEQGRFQCEPKNLPAGSITLQAKAWDDKGRATYANVGVSVYEAGSASWWTPSDSDRIDLLPEKNYFEPDEKAKLVVRSPFPVSTVLVTVEREGVLDSFVTEVKRDHPVIEVPLKGNYAPNVFISALALRGRVADPQPTALLDLARPAMKMGLTELKVGWKAHDLIVNVKSDKTKYRAREKAQITVQVKMASGENLPAGSEVAIAAVDESLLRLKENTSWKILKAMMGQRDLAVLTSSGQNQVIGRRHFGSKAKPPGGGGGTMAADARDLFEPVLLWQPKLKLDQNGQANITVPLNDSMTSFRIVAVATAGENFFGDGKVTIESTKDLIIYSGFAPMVREGDQIKNAFTIRNTTANPMRVSLEISSKEIHSLSPLPVVDLKPSEAKTLDWPLTIPMGLKEISFRIKAKDSSGASDEMIATVKVEPAVPNRVMQATLFQLDKTNQIPVKQASDAISGKGGLGVVARATLVSSLAGVKSFMQDYPYSCLEQKISRSIVLENKNEILRLIEILPSYQDHFGLLKFFPSSSCGSAQLTRYVMNILSENNYSIPAATQSRLVAGLTSYIQGRYACHSWWDDYVRDTYTAEAKILAMEALSRYKSFSTNLLSTVSVNPNLWKNETLTAWFQLLKRQTDIPNRDGLLKQAENILRSRVNFQGSMMNLQGDVDWTAQWLLLTSRDQEALGVFGVFLDEPTWGSDVGRMARGVIARLRLGQWDSTMANAWGVTQLRRFSQKFEKEKITGETKIFAPGADSASTNGGVFNWQKNPNGEQKLLNWPKGSDKANVTVQFQHLGSGKPWIHFETVSAIPLKAPLDMGYKITRKVSPVLQSAPGTWHVGDVANVEIVVTAKADQPWVVVRDPIPAGASHLGTGLDGSSNLLDMTPKRKTDVSEIYNWPTEYEEKSQANFVSYAAYLPRGSYRLNYRIRLNSAGEFKLPPSRVEAMYAPETFGEGPNANWTVVK